MSHGALRSSNAAAWNINAMPWARRIEGELDEVLDVVKQCVEELTTDCDRVECVMKLDYRKGHAGELKSRLARVEKRLGHSVKK